MSPAASSPSGRPSTGGYLSIGQVLARLTPEFPQLSTSKLRFLEVQGIVTPTRTESGYRRFTSADVERLRTALTLQRDHYLPLAVIREHLDEQGDDSAIVPPPSIVPTARRYKRSEVLKAAGAPAALLDDAVSAGLLPAADSFDDRSLALLRSLVSLSDHGIQPRHLRAMRQAAERDVALVESALRPLLRRPDAGSRSKAHELAPELLRRLAELRAAYVQHALDDLLS